MPFKALSRVVKARKMFPDLPLPPQSTITRGGTWLYAVSQRVFFKNIYCIFYIFFFHYQTLMLILSIFWVYFHNIFNRYILYFGAKRLRCDQKLIFWRNPYMSNILIWLFLKALKLTLRRPAPIFLNATLVIVIVNMFFSCYFYIIFA